MGLGVDPFPKAFYETALSAFLKRVDAPTKIKRSLYDAMLRSLLKGEFSRGALRQMRAIVYGIDWGWPEAKAYLSLNGADAGEDELLVFLFERANVYAHRLHRSGQIRSLLAENLGHWIRIDVSSSWGDDIKVSPCGKRDGEQFPPTQDVIKTLPPCDALDCCCFWFLFYPEGG